MEPFAEGGEVLLACGQLPLAWTTCRPSTAIEVGGSELAGCGEAEYIALGLPWRQAIDYVVACYRGGGLASL